MKYRIAILAAALALAGLRASSLTLDEAREAALKSNPGIAEACERIGAAEAVLSRAEATYLPVLGTYASAGKVHIDLQPDSDPFRRVEDGFEQVRYGARLSWLVFNGFARRATVLAARHGVEGAEETRNEVRRLIAEAVTAAFYRAALERENIAIATRDRAFNEALEKDARIRYEAGNAPEAEALNFSIRALRARTGELVARRDLEVACTVLAQLMAMPGARLPETMLPEPAAAIPATELPDPDAEAEFALQQRPDLRAVRARQAALRARRDAGKGSYYPTVTAVATVNGENTGDQMPIDQSNRDTYVGVNATWELYSGGQRRAAIREVEAELRATREQLRGLELAVRSEIRQQAAEAAAAREALGLQQEVARLTGRVREHVEKAYKAGVESLTRLNEAQTDLVRAEGAEAAARIRYLLAVARLEISAARYPATTQP